MNLFTGRRTSRSGNRLDAIIRKALEDRVAHAQPPEYGRQVLLARAREAQMKHRLPKLTVPFEHLPEGLRPVTSVLWAYDPRTGAFRRDTHLSLAINNFASPFLGVLR
jgi:hypothetical protein